MCGEGLLCFFLYEGVALGDVVEEELEGLAGGTGEVTVASVVLGELEGDDVVGGAAGKPDGADGEFGGASGRTGNAGYGDGEVGVHGLACALNHGLGHFFAVGCLLLKEGVVNVEEVLLDLVGIAHDAALEVVAGAGDGDDGIGYAAACAALCGGKGEFLLVEDVADLFAEYFVF